MDEAASHTQGSSFLQGQFLIAMPNLADPYFEHSVTLICQHDAEGCFGLTINRPIQVTVTELFEQLNIPVENESLKGLKALSGGPVQPEQGFVIHGKAIEKTWENTMQVTNDLYVTASRDILFDIAINKGPKNFLLTLGCASWVAGQMEAEVLNNSWLNCDANSKIIFDTPYNQRWNGAVEKMGINAAFISDVAGHD